MFSEWIRNGEEGYGIPENTAVISFEGAAKPHLLSMEARLSS
jgi:hypothetical protein